MHPGNPIYAVPDVPFVLALAMGSVYFLAMLVLEGQAWLKVPDKLRNLSLRDEPLELSDGSAIAYGLTSVLYFITAAAIHGHPGTVGLSWLGLVLMVHVIFAFWFWGMFRFPPLRDAIVMCCTSTNLSLYIGTRLFSPFESFLNLGQSITMYLLEASTLVLLAWAFLGPKRRARVTAFLKEDSVGRGSGKEARSRSRET